MERYAPMVILKPLTRAAKGPGAAAEESGWLGPAVQTPPLPDSSQAQNDKTFFGGVI
ncbi:MAG: hypothetical protein HYX80_04200 [Chloroflexi bacterium]|nr:hypothetical protein [Chloroflexota bacterium]